MYEAHGVKIIRASVMALETAGGDGSIACKGLAYNPYLTTVRDHCLHQCDAG
jgi:hypothetical protein